MCQGQGSSQRPQPGPVTGSVEAGNPERRGVRAEWRPGRVDDHRSRGGGGSSEHHQDIPKPGIACL